jgi:hypothetical protein
MAIHVPRITAIPIENILPHEKYDSKILNAITNSLQSEGVVRDPILVDSGSCMILDGTHRYWALKKLGLRSIPVALYDYLTDKVKIGCWYRCLEWCDLDISSPKAQFFPANFEDALNAVSERRAQLSIICKGSARIFRSTTFNIIKAYDLLSFFEKKFKRRGHEVIYATESDAINLLTAGKIGAMLAPPPILKEEATLAARTGKLFPIKSTRHIIHSRPIGVNVPLEWLKSDYCEANKRLQDLLSKGAFKAVPRGSFLEGRRYEEEVYIYELYNR